MTQQLLESPKRTRRLGSATGSDFSMIALISVNIAALAPIPSASVRIAVRANPFAFHNWRTANRTSGAIVSLYRRDRARLRSLNDRIGRWQLSLHRQYFVCGFRP